MKKEHKIRKTLAFITELGFFITVSIFAGLLLGKLLDNIAGTQNVYAIIFLLVGVVAGYEMLFVLSSRFSEPAEWRKKSSEKSSEKSSKKNS